MSTIANETDKISLYLCEKEERDGAVSYLDISVRLVQPAGWNLREKRDFSKVELIAKKVGTKEDVFSLFGIIGLKDGPGVPKGPYYSVDENLIKMLKDLRRVLFANYDNSDNPDRNYTWEYTRKECLIGLYDVGEIIIFTTVCYELDEETGAMGDYRPSNFCKAHVLGKTDFLEIAVVEGQTLLDLDSALKVEYPQIDIENMVQSLIVGNKTVMIDGDELVVQ